MAAIPALRPVACVAALNATAQGLIGVVLGVLGLCVCFCGLGFAPQASGNDLGQYLTFYLQGDECSSSGASYQLYSGLTKPTALRVWLALSLFFSASMLVSSLALFVAVAKRWSDEKLQITLVSWLFINTFTAVDDVILGYVFGNDYLTVRDSTAQRDSLGPLTLLLVTLVVARGVYLWLLNLAFILYLFSAARSLHKFLNQQVPAHDQQPIESWPTLDDFGKTKMADVDRTPTAINPRLTDRLDSMDAGRFPDYSAMARWPSQNGEAQTMRESRRENHREGHHRERRPRSLREPTFRRQEGVDNPAYDTSDIYYLRLQNDPGYTRDYDDRERDRRDARRSSRERARSRREVVGEATSGQYKQNMSPSPAPASPPPPTMGYIDEHGIIIPPVDYMDPGINLVGMESYKKGDYEQALKDAFLEFDATLATYEVSEILKKIAGGKDGNKPGSDGEDGSESEEEEMIDNLVQEATMPLDEVIAKYRNAGPLSRLKGEGKPPVSPMLRARRSTSGAGASSSGAGSSKGGDGEVSSSSSCQDTSALCNGDAHVNGEVETEEKEEGKSEAESSSENSEPEAVKSEIKKTVSVEVTESEKISRTEPDSSGISNGETHDVSSSSEKAAGSASNEAISSTSPPKKKKVSSAEIYKTLLQEESDSEEEDETFTADAESEGSSDEEKNEAEEDEEDSSLDDDDEDEDDEDVECHGLDDVKEEPGQDSGCTAVVALLVGPELYVANAGDSRCVVSREGKAVEMSSDHKPEDEPERERIENAGGKVTNDGRVNGGLNLSRAIGDHSYKQVALLPPQKQMITALPDVRTLSVNPEKDEFMVLACDGIWNSMTSQEVVDFVRVKLEQGTKRLSQICEELFDHCLAPNTAGDGTGCDNMTCVIVQFKPLEAADEFSGKRSAEDHEQEPDAKRTKVQEEVTQTS